MKKWGKIFGTIILLVMLVLIMKGSVQADDVQIWDYNYHHVGYIDSSGIYHPNNQTVGLDFNRVGGDFQGQIYGITNGMPNISGFYSVVGPPAGYRPIGVGLTGDQGRLGGNKQCPDANTYNCHDDESPVFSGTPFTVATPDNTKSFRVCADSCNNVYDGNRTKSAYCYNDPNDGTALGAKCGNCRWLDGQEYCGCYKDVTANCAPKCPAGTMFTKILGNNGCTNYDNCRADAKTLPVMDCKGDNYRSCWEWRLDTAGLDRYACEPGSLNEKTITGKVFFDKNNNCSTAVPWNQGNGLQVSINGTPMLSAVVGGANP